MGQLVTLLELGQAAPALTALEAAWLPTIVGAARRKRLEPALVMAIVSRESQFNPRAVNPHDPSYGLMQVMLPTAQAALHDPTLTLEQLMDPDTNLRAGTQYLSDQLRRYGEYGAAVAAYNAGGAYRTAAGRFVNQAYVDGVLSSVAHYRAVGQAAPETALAEIATEGAGPGAALAAGGLFAGALALFAIKRYRR